jgi:hypothetical protein
MDRMQAPQRGTFIGGLADPLAEAFVHCLQTHFYARAWKRFIIGHQELMD